MADAWLTPAEVEELTARKRWKAQCATLAAMGVPFRPNGVGRPLVERAAVLSAAPAARASSKSPNWKALEARRGQAA